MTSTAITKVVYIPHGGGPMPLLDEPDHDELTAYMRGFGAVNGRPEAIVVLSAHWEKEQPTITAHPNPDLLFDYHGFPPETYEYSYPAPASMELAKRLASAMTSAGFVPVLDKKRGFDHGVFVPLMLMYPDAKIPVVEVSLITGLHPETHISMGEALRPALEGRNVLVVGSGLSFHNLSAFRSGAADPDNEVFDSWLETVCTNDMSEAKRRELLCKWTQAPAARHNHPREEHLLPLHVCYGIAGAAATRSFNGRVMGKRVAAYSWS